METLLIDRWLRGATPIAILDEASVSIAREAVRGLARAASMSEADVGALATAVSELASNQLMHAQRGYIGLRSITREGSAGVEIVAADRGPGIAKLADALAGTTPRPGGLGIGLSGAIRLVDEVDLDVRLDEGTCVRARKFARRLPRRREIGVLGRACEGERVSGDDAVFVREGAHVVLAIADGLGHGPDAREASRRAVDVVVAQADDSLTGMLATADQALQGTRGAAMTIVRMDERAGTFLHAAVGNVAMNRQRHDGSDSFGGTAFVLGERRARRPRILEEGGPLAATEMIILFSDGLRTRARVEDRPDLFGRHPILVAHHLLQTFGREGDDATVIVAS